MARKARIARKTAETDITVEIGLDGKGSFDVKTPIPFLDHMLSNFARHGLFDLRVRAKGDVEVDLHHTVEDVGIVLGQAVKKALGGAKGVKRCADSTVPMMDSLSTVVLDISGRPFFKLNTPKGVAAAAQKIFSAVAGTGGMEKAFDIGLTNEFLTAFANSAGVDMHVTIHYGTDPHHAIEAVFKAFGRALSAASGVNPRIKGVLSTKGRL